MKQNVSKFAATLNIFFSQSILFTCYNPSSPSFVCALPSLTQLLLSFSLLSSPPHPVPTAMVGGEWETLLCIFIVLQGESIHDKHKGKLTKSDSNVLLYESFDKITKCMKVDNNFNRKGNLSTLYSFKIPLQEQVSSMLTRGS